MRFQGRLLRIVQRDCFPPAVFRPEHSSQTQASASVALFPPAVDRRLAREHSVHTKHSSSAANAFSTHPSQTSV